MGVLWVLAVPACLILGNLLLHVLHVRYSKASVGYGFGYWLYGPKAHQLDAIGDDVAANFD